MESFQGSGVSHMTSAKFWDFITKKEAKLENEPFVPLQIMNAILDDPEVVVETIAGVLDHESEVEEIENKLQLVDMIETDPLSATVVFTDLVIQKQQELNILEEDEEATTPAGHKYEDPPEAVRGQLLRLQMTDSPVKGKKKVS